MGLFLSLKNEETTTHTTMPTNDWAGAKCFAF